MKTIATGVLLSVITSCGMNDQGNNISKIPKISFVGPMMCMVTLKQIKDVAGFGFTWIEATLNGCNNADTITWSISPDIGIFVWPEDPNIAYFGGPNGTYTITASVPEGQGTITITISHE